MCVIDGAVREQRDRQTGRADRQTGKQAGIIHIHQSLSLALSPSLPYVRRRAP